MKKCLLTVAMAIGLCGMASADAQADVTLIANGDFTTLTEGSPESPVDFPAYGEGSFTNLYPSWGQSKVKKAGGQLLIQDNGYVRTPSSNMSANSGTVKVTTRVRMMDDYGGCLKVSVGYSSSKTIIIEDMEWHDVELVLSGGTSYSYVRVEPFLSVSGILVQNVKVEQSPAFIAAPEALQPSVADGTSFTARWRSVGGATAYHLDVYSYGADNTKDYVLENQVVESTATSYQVTGLDSSKRYYFVVRAANAYGVSADSNEIRVVKVLYYLDVPGNVSVSKTNDSFTATWDAVQDAESYFVNVMQTRTLTAPEEVELINEDFSKITSGAFDGIDFIINPDLDPYTQTPGWEGAELGKSVGNLVLTPLGENVTAYINTPAMNLSSDNGVCNVSVSLAEGAYGSFYSGGTVNIYIVDPAGNYLSTQTVTPVSGYETYNVQLTGGISNCRVGISYAGNYKIFIDEFKVTQSKPEGSQITNLLCEEEVTATTFSKSIDNPQSNVEYTLTVTAAAETVRSTDIVPIYSESSEPVVFTLGEGVGIAGIEADTVIRAVGNGRVDIVTAEPVSVSVYDMSGRCVYTSKQVSSATVETGITGFAIVKAGNTVKKIRL